MSEALYGYVKLGLSIFCIWLTLWVITPLWVKHSPFHQEFAQLQELHAIPIGSLYYTELPFITDAIIEFYDAYKYGP